MDKGWTEDYEALPEAGSHRLIEVDQAFSVSFVVSFIA
jgi:hypothetical protein